MSDDETASTDNFQAVENWFSSKPAAKGETVQLGEIVWLKSGGPAMTVKQLGDELTCIWFCLRHKCHEATFAKVLLTVERPEMPKRHEFQSINDLIQMKLGEIVWLKSDGPAMTVKQLGDELTCIWFCVRHECHEATFAHALLTKAKPEIE